ncbi:MAG: sulfite exporter TauE/SafE family protein [Sphingomonas sp.]|nr:sulfite exporter TauE/SafE family protein [Sphingomonas sp.]
MTIDLFHAALDMLSGAVVGFSLGLVGGGGSILAVPLVVYLVGVKNPHIAIGTSALAVAANAALGVINHARHDHVQWRCGLLFAGAGVAGAFAGSSAGKSVDGDELLFLFALVMVTVGVVMLRRRESGSRNKVKLSSENAPQLFSFGFLTGLFAGFFGIGGGFLIVPGLIAATDMAMIYAVGTSLVGVTAFGLTTALNYAWSGLVDWPLAGLFILGGFLGSMAGTRTAKKLHSGGALTKVFAGLIFVVAAYMLWRSWAAISAS